MVIFLGENDWLSSQELMNPGNPDKLSQTVALGNVSVLLVDDNKVNQFLGKRILQNLGVTQVSLAGSGEEALEFISNQHFDILLTDVEMPGMNGYELSSAIRNSKGPLSNMVIVALTANASDDDRAQANESGINDYLTKPYSPQDLSDVLLRNIVSLPQQSFVMEEMSSTENSTGGMQKLYAAFHQNKDDVRQFLHMLSQQLPQLNNQIKQGIISENLDEAFQAAHKLKSPVKMLASLSLCNGLSELTDALRYSKDIHGITQLYEKMGPELESLLILINSELESLDD